MPDTAPPSDAENERELIREAVREAVRDGIRDVLHDRDSLDAFWSSAYGVLQESATKQTGRLVLGSIKAVAAKGSLFVILGMLVYSIGGWTAVSKVWSSLWSNS